MTYFIGGRQHLRAFQVLPFYLFILMILREREEGRERNIDPLLHPSMRSLTGSRMCLDWRWNSQPWCLGTTLQPAELPSQRFSRIIILNLLILGEMAILLPWGRDR